MFLKKNRAKQIVKSSYGTNPLEGFLYYDASNRMEDVARFYHAIKNNTEVDTDTWSDLEMDQLFLRMNHTNSFLGEQFLYYRLHDLNKENCNRRRKLLEERYEEWERKPEAREEIEMHLQKLGKKDIAYFLPEFLMDSKLWSIGNIFLYHLLQFLLIGALVFSFVFDSTVGFVAFLFLAMINLMIYVGVKQKYEIYFFSLIEFVKIMDFVRWSDKENEVLKKIKGLRIISALARGMVGRNMSTISFDPISSINEYLWGILLIDVSLFYYILKAISKEKEQVIELLSYVGGLDSDIAICSYRKSIETWCRPDIVEENTLNEMRFKGLYHPLLKKPVPNDFEFEKRIVITGDNASGKSTFMKSLAINVILAQAINTCTSEAAVVESINVYTCMALRDNLLSGDSYYIKEAKRIKKMLEVSSKSRAFIVIDEILKGTNTRERIAASKAILDEFNEGQCYVLIATHDDELTKNSSYINYHMCSKIYRIQRGVNKETNAISLLKELGYSENLVERARKYYRENW